MSIEKAIGLDATLKLLRGPHHYRTVILSLDEAAGLLVLLDEALGLVADLEAEVTAWRAEGVQRYGMLAVAPDDPVQRSRSFLARFPTPSPSEEES